MKPVQRKTLVVSGIVILILGAALLWLKHGNPSDRDIALMQGAHPLIVDPEPEWVPSVKLASPVGWKAGEAPQAAKGLTVSRFAEGLSHPRIILALPNGDVLVSETESPPGNDPGGITGFFQRHLMSLVGAGSQSPNTIVLLRDSKGSGIADQRFVLRQEGLASPSGLAFANNTLYIANHDAVLAFPYHLGETTLVAAPKKLMDLPPAGNHWMRNLLLSEDGKKLYVTVGSASNIGERGMEIEQGRAAIWEIDVATGSRRQYAAGLRNPNGMGWNPSTGELWTVVNERDQLGPDLVPDYLTNVPIGAQYGWPWVYWKNVFDERVTWPTPDYLTEYTRKPEYALGPHMAPLGLLFAKGGGRLGDAYANGAFIARHGSWNRKPMAGYDVVFVGYDNFGNPKGMPQPVLTGFLADDDSAHGRPVWLAWDKLGGLLVSDDTGGIIWRVMAPGASAAAAPKPVVVEHLKPVKDLEGDPMQKFKAKFGKQNPLDQP